MDKSQENKPIEFIIKQELRTKVSVPPHLIKDYLRQQLSDFKNMPNISLSSAEVEIHPSTQNLEKEECASSVSRMKEEQNSNENGSKNSKQGSGHSGIHECNVCQKVFLNVTSLKKHIRIHTLGMPYVCDICQHGFMNEGSLKKHFNIHTDGKPFTCSICQKEFVNERSLKKHVQSHISGSPYKCEVCRKEYFNKGSLDKHIAIHGSGKPYVCPKCQKSFANEGNFKNHVKIHIGEDPISYIGSKFVNNFSG